MGIDLPRLIYNQFIKKLSESLNVLQEEQLSDLYITITLISSRNIAVVGWKFNLDIKPGFASEVLKMFNSNFVVAFKLKCSVFIF